MKKPPLPADEAERLASLKDLSILDTPAEERFDRITRLAARSLDTRISLVSLIDAERQWFKSIRGLTEVETHRDFSFCGHAILDDGAFVIQDASKDPRFADNPLVTGPMNIRLYAGQPIHAPDGRRIGTLCVIDPEPRSFGDEEAMVLEDLAILVENELKVEALSRAESELRRLLNESERRASIDALTRMWNRETILKLLDLEIDRAARSGEHVGVAMIDIDRFKEVNDSHGHSIGDEVLAAAAQRIRGAVRPYDSVGRYGGEEFLAVITAPDLEAAAFVGERIRRRISYAPLITSGGQIKITASVGVNASPVTDATALRRDLVDGADQALYAAKRAGRDRVCVYGEASGDP